ncbi:MAG: segregation and condensation protein [Patescibacteria group bacterium]|nr:segregation and condensation protein [Patescibacteria group bacterium]
MNLLASIEACLFVATKPISVKELIKVTGANDVDVLSALDELTRLRNVEGSGVHVLSLDGTVQLVTNPESAEVVARLAKDEVAPELTRPSLEALTIIAYRGPVTKPEIEAIRGVNCSLILRNLLMRGLIEERDDAAKLQSVFSLSPDALRFMGLHSKEELPDYATLHGNAHIDKLLATVMTETPPASV